MAESEFPDVYHWISHLPPPCLWSSPSLKLRLSTDGSLLLIAKRTENGCVSFFFEHGGKRRGCLGRDIKWSKQEDGNTNMHLITSPLLSFAIASISQAIHHPNHIDYYDGMDLPEVAEDSLYDHSSVTQSSHLPPLFNSAFACMCILCKPRLILNSSVCKFISPEILHPELDILQPLIQPLIQILGRLFTRHRSIRLVIQIVGLLFTRHRSIRPEKGWNPLIWSYAAKTPNSCEVKIYCPLLSMKTTHNYAYQLPAASSEDLQLALIYQQVECVIQLRYSLTSEGNLPCFHVAIANVRCDVFPYENLPSYVNGDVASKERYFPSKICITIAPQHGCRMICVGQSSANPTYQMAAGTAWEVSYQAPKDVGVKVSGTATSTMNFNAWKFEQSARDMQGTFKWVLCDTSDSNGREVISSKPSKVKSYNSKSVWYRDRYRKACSPFTEEGGVVFASDIYGKSFTWTLNESGNAQSLKVRIEGSIWVTYWPNLHKTSFYESRCHHFSQLVELPFPSIT